jgi:hypothetical protein
MIWNIILYLFLLMGVVEVWMYSLMFARQALDHVSHSTCPICIGYFWDRVSLFAHVKLNLLFSASGVAKFTGLIMSSKLYSIFYIFYIQYFKIRYDLGILLLWINFLLFMWWLYYLILNQLYRCIPKSTFPCPSK